MCCSAAPGNFVDLVDRGFYTKMAVQRSDGFVIQAMTCPAPCELCRAGEKGGACRRVLGGATRLGWRVATRLGRRVATRGGKVRGGRR